MTFVSDNSGTPNSRAEGGTAPIESLDQPRAAARASPVRVMPGTSLQTYERRRRFARRTTERKYVRPSRDAREAVLIRGGSDARAGGRTARAAGAPSIPASIGEMGHRSELSAVDGTSA